MTALSTIQSVCYRINESAPSALAAATDPWELQLIHILYAVCEELRRKKIWTEQKKKHSFDTVSGTSGYILPLDFYSPLLQTFWNEDEDRRLIGPESDGDFTHRLEGGASGAVNFSYRPFGFEKNDAASTGGQFKIEPTPSSAITLSFEYVSRNLFRPAFWGAGTNYTTSPQMYCTSEDKYYKCATAITSSDTAPSGTSAGIADDDGTWDYYKIPWERILTDLDELIFDEDIVKLGLRAKIIEDRGGDYRKAEDEYLKAVDLAVNRYRGSYVGSFSRRRSYPNLRVPYKSWSI